MCEPHFNTLRINWQNIKKLIENYPTCLNMTRARKFFQNKWTRRCHVSISMVIVKYLLMCQKILIHYSHVVWPMHSIYHYFFTHNRLMVTYKKLALNLHILSLLNYNQILFAMSFLDMLRICWYIKINSIESCRTCWEFFFKIQGQKVATFLCLWLL
jgi:hypothetical protein